MRSRLACILNDPQMGVQLWRSMDVQTILARHTCAHRVKELMALCDEIRCIHCRHRGRTELSDSLNIAFFGSSLLSAYWNGAATYYRGIIRPSTH